MTTAKNTKSATVATTTRKTTTKPAPVKPRGTFTIDEAVSAWQSADKHDGEAILIRGEAVSKFTARGGSVRELSTRLSTEYGQSIGKSSVNNAGVAYELVKFAGLTGKKSDAVPAITAAIKLINRTGGANHLRTAFREATPMSLEVFLATVDSARANLTAAIAAKVGETPEGTETDVDDDGTVTNGDPTKPKGDRIASLSGTITADEFAALLRGVRNRTWNDTESALILGSLADAIAVLDPESVDA